MSDKNDLLYLFDRPTEPVFLPKGKDGAVFEVPEEYLDEKYRPNSQDLFNRFGGGSGRKIKVKRINLPDLSLPLSLGRRENFSSFLPYHRKMATRLIEVFLGMRTLEDFISAAVLTRDRMNPHLYIYALSVAILHRPDTKDLPLPSLAEIFPDKFVDGGIFARAKEETNILEEGQRIPIVIPKDYTASDLDIEHRLAYFREDMGINLHHWHWHLVYPFDGPVQIVNKDRRGELFFYMHQQIIARYNFERLSNKLGRVKRFVNWREPIEEGYFPKLDSLVASRVWAPRFANVTVRDIDREVDQIKFDVLDLERWRDRIYAAIHSGVVVNDNGDAVELSEREGIDILGNILEASVLSVNRNLYGDLHNLGHVAISLSHDPESKHLETFQVMGDSATAMRDPVFYRFHAFVDDVFQEHKNTLPRYTQRQLDFPGLRVTDIEIETQGGRKNTFQTFWQQSDIDFSRGLDFAPRGSVFARITHLQHAPFTYRINIDNGANADMVTVRIFLAPKFDERGLPMLFRDQKLLFIELDKFVTNVRGKRNQVITRSSNESSVTIPFEATFRDLSDRPGSNAPGSDAFNFCGCGWPHHMLVPKGNAEGFPCELFVMVTNYKDDAVDTSRGQSSCKTAASFCGLRDAKYPDRRSMGFPFDRLPRDGVDTLQQFLTPNMKVQDVQIFFSERTLPPRNSN